MGRNYYWEGWGVEGFGTVDFFESWHVETVTANAKETGCGNLLRSGLAYSLVYLPVSRKLSQMETFEVRKTNLGYILKEW